MPARTTAIGHLLDAIFPRCCGGCDAPLAHGEGDWCRTCAEALLAATAGDYCPRCGRSAGPHLVDPDGCPACRGRYLPLEATVRLGSYRGILGAVIRKYKYGRAHRLDSPLARMLAARIGSQPWARDIEALVPVPITWRSRLRYGSFPVGLIAEQVGRELGLPAPPILRVRGKRHRQVDLPLSGRAANVRGVFHLRWGARVGGRTLCIVDDVATSGATLHEVARLLKRAGARPVYAAVLAKANPDQARVMGT